MSLRSSPALRRTVRLLLTATILLIVVLAGIYGAGSALPEEIVTVRGAYYRTPLAKVWEAVTDYEAMPQWNGSIESVRAIPDPETGNTLWHLRDSQGSDMVLRVTASAPEVMHRVELVEGTLPFSGSWEYEFMAKDGGTALKMTQQCHLSNPLARFLFYYVLGPDRGMEAMLQALGDRFVEHVEIEELPL